MGGQTPNFIVQFLDTLGKLLDLSLQLVVLIREALLAVTGWQFATGKEHAMAGREEVRGNHCKGVASCDLRPVAVTCDRARDGDLGLRLRRA